MQIQGFSTMDTRRGAQKYPSTSFCSLLLLWFPLSWLQLVSQAVVAQRSRNYLVGTGSCDITGPAADVNTMGYGNMEKSASGVQIRLYARVFIVAEPASATRVVFVILDACMASIAVTLRVLSRLEERYGELYTAKNVAISGTHTHSGPGGYLQYVLYLVTSGFKYLAGSPYKQTYVNMTSLSVNLPSEEVVSTERVDGKKKIWRHGESNPHSVHPHGEGGVA